MLLQIVDVLVGQNALARTVSATLVAARGRQKTTNDLENNTKQSNEYKNI